MSVFNLPPRISDGVQQEDNLYNRLLSKLVETLERQRTERQELFYDYAKESSDHPGDLINNWNDQFEEAEKEINLAHSNVPSGL